MPPDILTRNTASIALRPWLGTRTFKARIEFHFRRVLTKIPTKPTKTHPPSVSHQPKWVTTRCPMGRQHVKIGPAAARPRNASTQLAQNAGREIAVIRPATSQVPLQRAAGLPYLRRTSPAQRPSGGSRPGGPTPDPAPVKSLAARRAPRRNANDARRTRSFGSSGPRPGAPPRPPGRMDRFTTWPRGGMKDCLRRRPRPGGRAADHSSARDSGQDLASIGLVAALP